MTPACSEPDFQRNKGYAPHSGRDVLSLTRLGEAMKQPVERRLAAILAANVAGYSRLIAPTRGGLLAG